MRSPATSPLSRLAGRFSTGRSAVCTCCSANLLYRSYRRLTLPPLNLQPDELLDAVVVRLLKAMHSARPQTVRQFFALVNQHMRWELNDLARRLDQQPGLVEFDDENVPA